MGMYVGLDVHSKRGSIRFTWRPVLTPRLSTHCRVLHDRQNRSISNGRITQRSDQAQGAVTPY